MLNYNKNLKEYSRRLRKEMTDAERQLWARIRGKQLKNPPQSHFFKGGSYSFLKREIHRKVGRAKKNNGENFIIFFCKKYASG